MCSVALEAVGVVGGVDVAVANHHVAAVDDVEAVVVPIALGVDADAVDEQLSALVVLLAPGGGVAEGDAADGHMVATAEVDNLRAVGFVGTVVFEGVLDEAFVDEVHGVVGHLPTAAIDGAAAGKADVLLAHGKEQGGPAAEGVFDVVEGIEGAEEQCAAVEMEGDAAFEVEGAGDVPAAGQPHHGGGACAGIAGGSAVDGGLEAPSVEGDAVRVGPEEGGGEGVRGHRQGWGRKEVVLIEAEVVDDGASPCAFEDDAQPAGGAGGGEEDALVADGGGVGKGLPAEGGAEGLDPETLYALAQWDVLLQQDAVEGDGAVEGEGERGGQAAVGHGPVGVVAGVHHIGGGEVFAPTMGGGDCGVEGKVVAENAVEGFAQLHEAEGVGGGDEAAGVRRDVEQEEGVASHAGVIDIEKFLQAFGLLGGMVEPAGTDGDIGLGWYPDGALRIATVEYAQRRSPRTGSEARGVE